MNRRTFLGAAAASVLTGSLLKPKGSKLFLHRCTFLKGDHINGNNRVYSSKVLDSIVQQFNKLPPRAMIGEFGPVQDSIIHLNNASHIVKEMYREDDCLIAEFEVLNTPSGKKVEELIDFSVKNYTEPTITCRARGVGECECINGVQVVKSSYRIIAVDILQVFDAAAL